MTEHAQGGDGGAAVTPAALTGDLTIYQAGDVVQRLRDWLDGGVRAIDLAGVEQCDSAGVQLLLAARHTAAGLGQPLAILNPSASVREIFSRYGLGEHLADRAAD
jgi:anti-anti-sigma factor